MRCIPFITNHFTSIWPVRHAKGTEKRSLEMQIVLSEVGDSQQAIREEEAAAGGLEGSDRP